MVWCRVDSVLRSDFNVLEAANHISFGLNNNLGDEKHLSGIHCTLLSAVVCKQTTLIPTSRLCIAPILRRVLIINDAIFPPRLLSCTLDGYKNEDKASENLNGSGCPFVYNNRFRTIQPHVTRRSSKSWCCLGWVS